MKKFSFLDRVRYKFDNTLSRGTAALIAWLFTLSMLMLLVFSALVVLFHILPDQTPFSEVFWLSMMRALDPGTVAGDTGGWPFRLSMFGITVGGIFLVSVLIGVITSGIESKLTDLRKGRSMVVENGHTIILGWGPQVFSIISELVIANQNQKDNVIVVLAPEDKVSMEDEIREKLGSTGRTRVVCRTGNPLDQADLEITSLATSKAVIIPAPEMDDADTHVIKSILAIINNPNRRPDPYHIVAELRDSQNLEVARMVGKEEVELVLADDLISRITVQASLQSGLSVVYTDLLDFAGDEVYFDDIPELAGLTFGEALLRFEDSALIGLYGPDGQVKLNPGMDAPIGPDVQVVAISADDDTIRLSNRREFGIDISAIRSPDYVTRFPLQVLILGWNRRAALILKELDQYLFQGSQVHVVAEHPDAAARIEAATQDLTHAQIAFQRGDITDRRVLDSLHIQTFRHVVLLSYSDHLPAQQADARTLVTLLHLRDIAEKTRAGFTLTTEMLNVRNRDLASVTSAEDFIVSSKLVSLMLSQLSENKALSAVFEDLFNVEGSELYLKPAGDYVKPGAAVNFYTVVEAARRKGEVAIGYRLYRHADNPARQYGVNLNPLKSEAVEFEVDDRVIVLSES